MDMGKDRGMLEPLLKLLLHHKRGKKLQKVLTDHLSLLRTYKAQNPTPTPIRFTST